MGFEGVPEAHQLMLRQQAPRQDRDPRRRDRGGPGQDGRRARARSTPRSGRSGWPAWSTSSGTRPCCGRTRSPPRSSGVAPLALRYGATQYAVHRSRRRPLQDHARWRGSSPSRTGTATGTGPEMIEFRRRNSGRYQIPITYVWHEELAAGALGPEVPLEPAPEPEPGPRRRSHADNAPATARTYASRAMTRAHKIVNLIGVPLPLVGAGRRDRAAVEPRDRPARAGAAGRHAT